MSQQFSRTRPRVMLVVLVVATVVLAAWAVIAPTDVVVISAVGVAVLTVFAYVRREVVLEVDDLQIRAYRAPWRTYDRTWPITELRSVRAVARPSRRQEYFRSRHAKVLALAEKQPAVELTFGDGFTLVVSVKAPEEAAAAVREAARRAGIEL